MEILLYIQLMNTMNISANHLCFLSMLRTAISAFFLVSEDLPELEVIIQDEEIEEKIYTCYKSVCIVSCFQGFPYGVLLTFLAAHSGLEESEQIRILI